MDVKHKDLISVYETIKKEIRNGRWVGISEDDITHSYDSKTDTTNIIVKFADKNNHTHICTFQYNPDFRIDWAPEKEVISIIYRFEGKFEKGLKHRSFAKYLSHFHNDMWAYGVNVRGNRFTRHCDYEFGQESFLYLIDTVVALIKPLEWFTTTQNLSFKNVGDFNEYVYSLFQRIKAEADKGRWEGLNSKHFFISDCSEPFKEINLNLLFHFDRTFDLKFNLNVFRFRTQYATQIQVWFGRGLYLYTPMHKDSLETVEKLLTLFSDFMGTMKFPKKDKSIWVSTYDNRIEISPPLDEVFDYYCKILDDFMENLHNFKFQIPVPVSDNEPSDTIKEVVQLLEKSLNTTFEILPELSEEQEVNERLKRIYVWTEEPSSRVENVGISNCATLLNQDGN